MKTAQDHYAEHLAPIYLWSVGGSEAAFSLAERELNALHLPTAAADSILDLGAGFGMHAIPLAQRGASVTAVDSSGELLRTLRELAGGLAINAIQSNLVTFLESNRESYAAILCMGDTVTHLRNLEDVEALLEYAHRALKPGGLFVLTFRDYSAEPAGEQKFFLVRADDAHIHTCFLDNQDHAVTVHDILHERMQQSWQMRISAYSKLRLEPQVLIGRLQSLGFTVQREAGLRGMVRVVATKK